MNENHWINAQDTLPTKRRKFLFSYHSGTGLGQWGQCYTIINGNSERTHEAYILILDPQSILDGEEPFQWNDKKILEMEVSWMEIPK